MRRIVTLASLMLLLATAILMSGCSSSGNTNATIAVSPATVTVIETKTQSFTATVTGAGSASVVWSVQESGGGSISSAGNTATYTAPGATGTFHVVASLSNNSSVSTTAAVTVQAGPAPVFTSTPPTSAEEGSVYTYDITATDPAGGTVSYAVTSGPGAVSGSTFGWTPTHAQSRTADAFTVTATTSEGGTATQSWSVTPSGTIQGTLIETYVSASGATTALPQDLSTTTFNALIPNGSGGYTTYAGAGTPSGTFAIPGVPAGLYWLQYGTEYDQITTSDPNLSYYAGGRPNPASADGNSSIAVTANGFPSSITEACDSWWVPNLDTNDYENSCLYGDLATVSGGTLTDTIPLGTLMDSSQGDQGYFIASTLDSSYAYPLTLVTAGYAFGPDALTTPLGGTTLASGSVSPLATQSTTVAVQRSAFAALRSAANPDNGNCITSGSVTVCGGLSTNFNVQPSLFGDLYGMAFYNEPYVLQYSDASGDATDFDLGSISFGDFDSTEPLVYSASDSTTAISLLSGAYYLQSGNINVASATAFTTSSPATPVVGPVNSPAINGTSFFPNQTIPSATPTLSWSAPTVGTPTYYEVLIYGDSLTDLCPPDGCFYWLPQQFIAVFLTAGTQLTLPPGILSAGGNYQVFLLALNDPGGDLLNEQFMPSLNYADAESQSGLITVAGGSTSKSAPNASHVASGHLSSRVLRDQARIRQQEQQSLREIMGKQRHMHMQ